MLCKINQKFTYLALAPPFSNATVGFWSVGERKRFETKDNIYTIHISLTRKKHEER